MSLKDKINQDLKSAMKEKDSIKLDSQSSTGIFIPPGVSFQLGKFLFQV